MGAVTVFLDTAVFVYAAGSEHPLRAPCQAVLARAVRGEIAAATSAEVIQELVHRYLSIRRVDAAVSVAREVLVSFAPVLAIDHAVVARLPELVSKYPGLTTRDLVHVATCLEEGITDIVTPDRGFDRVAEIRRIDPERFAA
jgi:predicted nucleic acid-binding protein